MLGKIVKKLTDLINQISCVFVSIPDHYHIDLPYYSQFEDSKLVRDIIEKNVEAESYKKWKQSGAKSREEYQFWANKMCGMACLKMILKKEAGKIYPIVKLGKLAAKYGAYRVEKDDIPGLFYDQFTEFVKEEFNLKASYSSMMSIKRIMLELSKGNYVIASVSPLIRYANDNKKIDLVNKGGHLVVMTGYDLGKRVLYLHNPSGFFQHSQRDFEIGFEKFLMYFAGRAIIVYSYLRS